MKLIVEDTTKPTFETSVENVEVNYGQSDYDYSQHFKVNDVSEVDVSFDTSSVDYQNAGEYEAKVMAKDAYDNVNEMTFKVIVKEEEKEEVVVQATPSVDTTYTQTNNVGSPTYVNGIMIINKKHPLPIGYAPGENGEAGNQVRLFIREMQDLGYNISSSYSGYRSYAYQAQLYQSYVNSYGQASADTFSARPGYSEHQSGLAFDLLNGGGALVTSEPEVSYIAQNAHRYGFIVRYQYGKEHITGYQGEPWHLRYVGSAATAIYQSGLTLEEYLGVAGGGY